VNKAVTGQVYVLELPLYLAIYHNTNDQHHKPSGDGTVGPFKGTVSVLLTDYYYYHHHHHHYYDPIAFCSDLAALSVS
jgi:hypothetical protein